jgi:hypothetical protein
MNWKMVTADHDVPLPDDGREIRYRRKGQSDWKVGIVALVWAYEEAIIDVKDGGSIIPAFGDEWFYT